MKSGFAFCIRLVRFCGDIDSSARRRRHCVAHSLKAAELVRVCVSSRRFQADGGFRQAAKGDGEIGFVGGHCG